MRLGVSLLLLIGLVTFGSLVWPGVSYAAPSADDTIVYIVKPGDTLRSIAAANGTTIAAIVRANSLANPDMIYPGQKLVIPSQGGATSSGGSSAATHTPTSAPVSPTPGSDSAAAGVYYTVQLGDTLASIGAAYGVSASAIIAANSIDNPDLIWVGQKLLIPGTASSGTPTAAPASTATPGPGSTADASATPQAQQPSQPAPTQPPALAKPTVYVVQAGDTLGKIALRFGTTVAAIVAVNDLPNSDMLGIGQQLIIPKPGDPALTSATLRPSKFVVSISQQRCWLYQGDTVIAKWVCSTGRPGTGTRPGTYKIQSKMPKAFGSTWNIWMPYWLGIYWAGASENGIHGLPWNASSGAQIWRGYVGTPITFGCVMLDNVNAKMLYDVAYIGMPVIINP